MEELEIFANVSKVLGADSYFIEMQSDIWVDRLKHLYFNYDYIEPFKELNNKTLATKEAYFKAEKAYLTRKEKILAQIGSENSEKIKKSKVKKLMPIEDE